VYISVSDLFFFDVNGEEGRLKIFDTDKGG
jgi:hypothetical protein